MLISSWAMNNPIFGFGLPKKITFSMLYIRAHNIFSLGPRPFYDLLSFMCLLKFNFLLMLTLIYLAWFDHAITLLLTKIGLMFWLRLRPNRTVTDLLSFIFSLHLWNEVDAKLTGFWNWISAMLGFLLFAVNMVSSAINDTFVR